MFRDVPGCSGMFRNVPACSGMFHVPGFIDGPFEIPYAVFTLFGSARVMYPNYPVLNMMKKIHLRCGSFGSIISFWISVKK